MKLKSAKNQVGLVIRAADVELLVRQGNKVVTYLRIPLPEQGIQARVGAIKEVLTTAGVLGTNRLFVSILTQDVVFRCFTIPMIPKSDWNSAVQFEARKYIPFKIDKLVWDAAVVPSKIHSRLDVIFTAIPREVLEDIQEVLKQAGVVPTVIEPRTVSLARLMAHKSATGVPRPLASLSLSSASEPFVCLVDIDKDTAHLAIVKDGLPYLARDVSLVVDQHSEGLQGQETPLPKSISIEEGPLGESARVESTLRQPESIVPAVSASAPFPSMLTQASGTSMPSDQGRRIQRLLSELNVSMDFFTREHPSATIEKVWLFGDDQILDAWQPVLAEQLQNPVELGRVLLDQHVDLSLPTSFASAIGLLEVRGDITLDFLRRSQGKDAGGGFKTNLASKLPIDWTRLGELVSRVDIRQLALCGVAAVGLLILIWFAGYQRVMETRKQLEAVIQSRPSVGWGLAGKTQAQLQPSQTNAQAQLALLSEVIGGRALSAVVLDQLARSLPDGVWLTSLMFENKSQQAGSGQFLLSVQGACYLGSAGREVTAIQEFEERMKRSPVVTQMHNVRVDTINAQVSQQYTYRTFQLQYKSDSKL